MSMIASEDLRTLQLAPLWVLSSLSGTHASFPSYELEAFWDAVVEVSLRTPSGAREILGSLAADRTGLVLDYELDDRSVVTGLTHTLTAMDRLDPTTAADYKIALLRIGVGTRPGPRSVRTIDLAARRADPAAGGGAAGAAPDTARGRGRTGLSPSPADAGPG